MNCVIFLPFTFFKNIRIFVLLVLIFTNTLSLYSQDTALKRPKIGVVLSGGGAKGLAHIGVLKEIEKAGIPVDYIAGTSMGAIVGGLYAIGYTASQLDTLTRYMDWDYLLTDKISRNHVSMIEKDDEAKYMVSFPIREKKIVLPLGIVSGQNISTRFSELCIPVYNEPDFSKFQIPFFCVAADIADTKEIILGKGNLPQALRASMAIPTIFTPEEIDGRLLLDGGIINNFPVKELKNRGADIIIGVDVAFDSVTTEINSIVKVVTQTMLMYSRERSMENRKLCDILILPELTDYTSASFNRADSLITRGERAAQKMKVSLSNLSSFLRDSFNYEFRPRPRIRNIDVFFVDEIEISGLKEIPSNFLYRKMPFTVPSAIRVADIEKFISNIYGTRFFERITYKFEIGNTGLKLKFDVIERNTDYFRAGLHYDSDFKTTLMLNTTFRNKISKGSKISVDLALGENPSFSFLYYKNSGWNPRYNLLFWSKLVPDFGFHLQFHNIEVYDYVNDKKQASYGFTDITTDFFIQGNISNSNAYGLLLRSDYTNVAGRIGGTNYYEQNSHFFNIQGYYRIDTHNESYFPNKGLNMFAEAKLIKGISKEVKNSKGFMQASLRSNFIQPLGKRFAISECIYAGTLLTDTMPSQYWYYVGGMGNNLLRGSIPFVGMDFMQRAGNHALVTRLGIQWEMWNDNFLSVKSNIGKLTRVRKNLLVPEDILLGYGISYGYRSPIGPMELTLMSSNKNPGLSVFISIGYWF